MSSKTTFRLIVLLSVSLLLMVIGRYTPLRNCFSVEYLSSAIVEAGAYGVVLFVVTYVVGTLMNIPGMIFLFILFLVYDGMLGLTIGYFSTLLSMVTHFHFTRTLAGEVLSEIKQPFIRKQVSRLTDRPLQTTIVLRLLLFISPPVNYALALSSIRFRHFLLGSMIAMPVNLLINYWLAIHAKEWVVRYFG